MTENKTIDITCLICGYEGSDFNHPCKPAPVSKDYFKVTLMIRATDWEDAVATCASVGPDLVGIKEISEVHSDGSGVWR